MWPDFHIKADVPLLAGAELDLDLVETGYQGGSAWCLYARPCYSVGVADADADSAAVSG